MSMSKYMVGQKVEIIGNDGKWYPATVYNQNSYRPPEIEYAVDVEGMEDIEPVFCSEKELREIIVDKGDEKK
jgi:hypothetical protein